jgi:hypothetical protein
MAVLGLAILGIGLFVAPILIWSNLLIATFYLVTIGLGGALVVALGYVSCAGWSVAFRRIPEAMARTLPITGILLLLVLGARMDSYGWHHHGSGDPGVFWFKELWLTPTFWAIRAVVYIGLWILLSSAILAVSRRQDRVGGVKLTVANIRLSALFLVVYAITFTLASWDWLLALEPMWFSTMWGVYNFSGMAQAALAVVIILGLLLRTPRGPLEGTFTDDHLHDLGKLLLGFSCFWMYIWFSQYMLIWYSNLPEETSYFVHRIHGPWGPVVILSIILNWIVPFFVLLPRPCKRSSSVMMKVAVVVLIGRWIDLSLMVLPSTTGDTSDIGALVFVVSGLWAIAAIGFAIGLFSVLFSRVFGRSNPLPERDPFLTESLHHHC